MLIGITGGSGAGKTEFIKRLRQNFVEQDLALISADNYYLPRDQLKKDQNGVVNFDLPDTIDHHGFITDLKKLKGDELVRRKEYTFNNEKANAKEIIIHPAKVYIVEGLFILHEPEVRRLLDLIILIDASDIKKISRRILRDQAERNYPLDDVLYRYNHHVAPAFDKFIVPYLEYVDLIVNNNHNFDKALDVMARFIRSICQENA